MSRRRRRQLRRTSTDEGSEGGPAADTSRAGSRFDFNPDYSYIQKDLQRIGLLTGLFLAVLVALSFFL